MSHTEPIHTQKMMSSRRRKPRFIPRIGCLKSEAEEEVDHPATTTTTSGESNGGGFSMEMAINTRGDACISPDHLVVTVNGIVGSAGNWKFAAKQFLTRYPRDVLVHCSECNSSMLTLDGVDVMGERLADEIISVINHRPKLQKISFVCHSLGGLIARYAIGKLYRVNITKIPDEGNSDCTPEGTRSSSTGNLLKGTIAGLEPMNFITFATPHLGIRGHKQVPGFGSLRILEKLARRSSWILRRTGKHLFLTDNDNGKPPLLLQMVNDCGDLKFMSALHSFRRRVTYANARFDFMVGWRTSSIRRQNELPKIRKISKNEKYPHILNVEAPITATSEHDVHLEDKTKELKTDDMEEIMINGLTRVGWERVDVSFRGSKQRFFAHSTIQVKTYRINSDGTDVIFHMFDNFLL